jgi:hypothetical protein
LRGLPLPPALLLRALHLHLADSDADGGDVAAVLEQVVNTIARREESQ